MRERKGSEKNCTVCHVPVRQHVGRHGSNNCLGPVFTMVFQDIVSELKIVRNFLEVEGSEAKSKEEAFAAQLANVTRLFERECAEAKD